MLVRKATKKDLSLIFKMAKKLWPDVKASDLSRPKFTYYIAEEGDAAIGFIMLAVRKDYVEGSTTSPIGYVEGIFVEKGSRKQSVGRELIKAAEAWCVEKGFRELGSDIHLRNTASQKFHERVGFGERSVLVHYIKKVRPNARRIGTGTDLLE